MQHFPIDDDLVQMVWRLAKPQPFEQLTFSDALRRVLAGPPISKTDRQLLVSTGLLAELDELELSERLLKELEDLPEAIGRLEIPGWDIRRRERKPSPDASAWVASVPDLAGVPGLKAWRAVCTHLGVEVGGDSARRRLQTWVAANRPEWPVVPDAKSWRL